MLDISFIPHIHTNNLRFVPDMTFSRTYQVEIHKIQRELTTFLKVIFTHSFKKNKSVHRIRHLDTDLS